MSIRVAPVAMNNNPLVTVIICVYNAGEYFRPALQSILNQTYSNLEIIVVDDGSSDGCIETASDLLTDDRVRLFRQANSTKPVALNRALEAVRGEFYAQQDADDVSYPTRIEKQLAALLSKPDVAAAFCGHELILRGRPLAPTFSGKSEAECRRGIEQLAIPAQDPTGMYRMSLIGDMRYEVSLPGLEGVDYVLRIGEKYPMIVVGECLYQYRITEGSLTRSDPDKLAEKIEATMFRAVRRRGLPDEARYSLIAPAITWRSKNAAMDNYLGVQFIKSVIDQKNAGRWLGALKTGLQCAMLHPLDVDYYRALTHAVFPVSVISSLKKLYFAVAHPAVADVLPPKSTGSRS